MKITSLINSTREDVAKPSFPILKQNKKSRGLVVLFTSLTEGMVVGADRDHIIGEYLKYWQPVSDTSEWETFYGEITLRSTP